MASRLKLHSELQKLLGAEDRVYFDPPESVKMRYPAIVYELNRINQRYADDKAYRRLKNYSVTIITRDPDTSMVDDMLDSFSYCAFEREYRADNLHHYSFILYY